MAIDWSDDQLWLVEYRGDDALNEFFDEDGDPVEGFEVFAGQWGGLSDPNHETPPSRALVLADDPILERLRAKGILVGPAPRGWFGDDNGGGVWVGRDGRWAAFERLPDEEDELIEELENLDPQEFLRPYYARETGGWIHVQHDHDGDPGERWLLSVGEAPGNAWGRWTRDNVLLGSGGTLGDGTVAVLDAGVDTDDDSRVAQDENGDLHVYGDYCRDNAQEWAQRIYRAFHHQE